MFDVENYPIPIGLLGNASVLVTNIAGDTLYYADHDQVSSSNFQGVLLNGSSATFIENIWVVSASRSTVTLAFTAPSGGSSGSSGGSAPTVQGSVGTNLGAAVTVDFASTAKKIILVGTLNANCTVTLANRAAGSEAVLLLTQDATGGRTLQVSDGTTPVSVTVASAANALTIVAAECPDASTIDLAVVGGSGGTTAGALLAANNLSDLANAGTARTNLGLGSAATQASTAFDASGAATAVKGLPLGLTGATAATRYVGATASGAPASGTFAIGDFVIDQTGKLWVCTTAGSPGTWSSPGGWARSQTDGLYMPQWPGLVVPPGMTFPTSFGTGSAVGVLGVRGVRAVVPKAGTLHDVSFFVTASSGNLAVAVYDTGDAAGSGTRTLLYSSGSVACGAANAWQTIDPALSVSAGQQLDIMLSADNGTATFTKWASATGQTASQQLPNANFNPVPGGALPKLIFSYPTLASLTGWTATVTEANVSNQTTAPALLARVA